MQPQDITFCTALPSPFTVTTLIKRSCRLLGCFYVLDPQLHGIFMMNGAPSQILSPMLRRLNPETKVLPPPPPPTRALHLSGTFLGHVLDVVGGLAREVGLSEVPRSRWITELQQLPPLHGQSSTNIGLTSFFEHEGSTLLALCSECSLLSSLPLFAFVRTCHHVRLHVMVYPYADCGNPLGSV